MVESWLKAASKFLSFLRSARSRSGKVRVVGEADLAFDSAKGLAEQPTDAEADDWERRLNARG